MGKAFIIIQSTLSVTSECSKKKLLLVYQLTLPEVLAVMGWSERKVWKYYFIGWDIYPISGYPTIINLNEVVFVQYLSTVLYIADTIKKLIDMSNKSIRKFLLFHWSQKVNGNSENQSSSNIFARLSELMQLSCLMLCTKNIIHMIMENYSTLLTRRYHVRH